MRKWAALPLGVVYAAAPALAVQKDRDEVERVRQAAAVLAELATAPSCAIPKPVLERADALGPENLLRKAFKIGEASATAGPLVRVAGGAVPHFGLRRGPANR